MPSDPRYVAAVLGDAEARAGFGTPTPPLLGEVDVESLGWPRLLLARVALSAARTAVPHYREAFPGDTSVDEQLRELQVWLTERPGEHHPPVSRDFARCEPSWQRAAGCAVAAALAACAAAGPAQRMSLDAPYSAQATHHAVQSALRAKLAAWLETNHRARRIAAAFHAQNHARAARARADRWAARPGAGARSIRAHKLAQEADKRASAASARAPGPPPDARFRADLRSAIAADVLPWLETVDPLPADVMLTGKHLVVDARGRRVEVTFDEHGRLLTQSHPLG